MLPYAYITNWACSANDLLSDYLKIRFQLLTLQVCTVQCDRKTDYQ
jgi:hypothetical protein